MVGYKNVMTSFPILILLVLAALAFTAGGVCMKYSEGLTRLGPSIWVGILFLAGAGCQALAMRREELSVTYIFVLGLESVLAFVFGVLFFGEEVSVARISAVILITAGIVLLHR
jgi:small multidrug resistance pump/quaternary ammonium compound-resistance protein SugE